MEKAILSSNLIAKALDMESFGIAYACEMADSERPTPIIAKGISDFADEKKSDSHQSLAAENSAVFIRYLLLNLPADIDLHSLFESWTCIIDKRDSSIHYINAGHPDPFIIRNDGNVEEITNRQNNPKLGLKDAVFKESQMHFMAGESLFLFSSGIEPSLHTVTISKTKRAVLTHRPSQQIKHK